MGGDPRTLQAYRIVGALTCAYSVAEIGVGLWLRSLLLLSDGFHNFSDVAALALAYLAESASDQGKTSRMSFGYRRTKLVGGLINNVALFTLAVYVALDALPKFIFPEALTRPLIIVGFGAAGLVINAFGTLILGMLGLGHDHSHGPSKTAPVRQDSHADLALPLHEIEITVPVEEDVPSSGHASHHHHDSNLVAVFTHYLGDAVSSCFVVIAGLLAHFFDAGWTMYIDPTASYFVVILLIASSLRPIRDISWMLLQGVPRNIDVDKIIKELLAIKAILSVHELHIWELIDGLPIASVHVTTLAEFSASDVIDQIKQVFHRHNVHSSTIQLEAETSGSDRTSVTDCENNCVVDCVEEFCCKKE
ncbi:hypothetical protein HDU89_005053 [Geranomyces variabilis]|nr:hypothetical protein HDU89_005053 [Geranomyces variabilis]